MSIGKEKGRQRRRRGRKVVKRERKGRKKGE